MRTAKAGWAQFDSTPPLGLPMGGRGPRFSPGSEVLDPLVAQAVVIEDQKGYRTVWISIDMIGMTWHVTSRLRCELASITGIPPARFLPWAVGLIRLTGEHTIAWLGNEVVAEWLPLLRSYLNDPDLIAWGYCQDGRNYMPTDALIPEGGYEVDRANAYTKAGPGPFQIGIDEVTKMAFLELTKRL